MMAYIWKRSNEVHGKYDDSFSGALLVGIPIAFGLILLITNFLLVLVGLSIFILLMGIHLRLWNVAVIGLVPLVLIVQPYAILIVLVVHVVIQLNKKEATK